MANNFEEDYNVDDIFDDIVTESENDNNEDTTEFDPVEALVAIEAELGFFDEDDDVVAESKKEEEAPTEETCKEEAQATAPTEESCDETTEDTDDDDVTDDASFDDLSPEELAALDAELRDIDDEDLDDADDDDDTEISIGDDDVEVNLSPDEEQEADDMMQVAATTMLINDELNDDEKADFVKNESATAIKEGFMTDADVNMIAEAAGVVTEGKYTSKQIIRLSAESKQKQLYALAVNVSAAAHGDSDYMKLRKLMKMRKILRAKLEKKYHSEATKRMRVYFRRLQSSKSPVVNKLADKVSK